jgi:hypothetical protein
MTVAIDRLFVDENDRELYDRLETTDMFAGKTRKEQFLFSLAVGFSRGIKRPIQKREGFFLAKDMTLDDEALFSAVAASDADSVEVLPDRAKVFRIAEEYAHAGIRILVDEIDSTQYGTFEKNLEKQLHDMYDRIGVATKREQSGSTPN